MSSDPCTDMDHKGGDH